MNPSAQHVTVVGGGLAGSEAAWQLARRGIRVVLHEMRPASMTPAHRTGDLAELVCSNSLKGTDQTTATGLLKHELRALGSLVLETAEECRVPAGAALAVDREQFSKRMTARIESEPLITMVRGECTSLPAAPAIIATGPLTSDSFTDALSRLIGHSRLHFFDAAAPVVEAASIDHDVVFAASRYGKGEGADYLNAPMGREEYERFHAALVGADRVTLKEFERKELFAACQPVEEVARTGLDALRFGALKPVGLVDPRTGERPWAVVQLRAENRALTAFNLVGFQTNLTFAEQRRVFSMIPGLEHAEFVRFGVMHRNTFLDAPRLLDATLQLRVAPGIRMAGQLTGTEGYLEAAASGLLAALNTYAESSGAAPFVLPPETVLGALIAYATDPDTADYQPMHVNFGLVPPLAGRHKRKRERYAAYSERGIQALSEILATRHDLHPRAGDRD